MSSGLVMRVISGKLRNRNLSAGSNIRPTTDRVRETLFNILQNEIEDSVFVDAYAGSGSVGIEALSRGAGLVYFIESSGRALKVLEANLERCGKGLNWRIYSLPVPKALEVIKAAGQLPDIIFFDPPYHFDQYSELITRSAFLFPRALLILETSSRTKFVVPSGVQLTQQRKIGETSISFFIRSVEGD